MQIRTDDDVYRVDAVWLGPPRATFPWRARYSSYGVGLVVMVVVMFFQRRLGIPIGFFSVAWALLITIVVVRFVAKRIDEDRPLLEWLTLFVHELRGPRRRTRPEGSAVGTGHVQIAPARPRRALPAGRTDPHAALATVPDRGATGPERGTTGPDRGAPEAGRGTRSARDRDPADRSGRSRRLRRPSRRSWTTRGVTPPPPPPREPTAEATALAEDGEGVLHVTARRADRSAGARAPRTRSRPVTGPRRFGPSSQGAGDQGAGDGGAGDGGAGDRVAGDRGAGDDAATRRADEAAAAGGASADEEGDGAAPARS